MQPFRILQVIRPAEGGMKEHLLSLVKGIDDKKFAIDVACPKHSSLARDLERANIKVYDVPLKGPINIADDLQCIKRIKKLCIKNRYHLVHCHGSKAGFVGRFGAYRAGTKAVVMTAHNFILDYHKSYIKKILFTKGEQYLGKNSDCIITVSEALKQEYLNRFRIPPGRVSCIYNGIDISQVKMHQPSELRKRLKLSPKTIVIGTLARMAPQKGLKYLLEAISYIKEKKDAFFVIAGDGPLQEELVKQAEDLGISSQVWFPGYCKNANEILSMIDLFVIPSVSEGLSITAIEAMAAGKPIIASKVGGLPEVVQDGITGLLVPPADSSALAAAMLNLLDNSEKMNKMGKQGQQIAREKFSLENMILETEKVYTRLLN